MLDVRNPPGEAPAAAERECDPPIDRAHLFRMTLGDHALAAEVLRLFEQQAGLLLARMRDAQPDAAAAFAHTLDGSARAIGAWPVSRAAQALRRAAAGGALAPAIEDLQRTVDEALIVVADILRPR